MFSDDSVSSEVENTFGIFSQIYNLRLEPLIHSIVRSLQGDNTADRGACVDSDGEEEQDQDDDMEPESLTDNWPTVGRGFEVARGSDLDLGTAWTDLKTHFAQAKSLEYRPGLTMIADSWVFSLSIPLKSISLDPNTLAMWDDDLVGAWKADKRFTLLVKTQSYPLHLDTVQYHVGFDSHCELALVGGFPEVTAHSKPRQASRRDDQEDSSRAARRHYTLLPLRSSRRIPQNLSQSVQDPDRLQSRLAIKRSYRVRPRRIPQGIQWAIRRYAKGQAH